MRSGVLAFGIALFYYALVYGTLTVFKVKPAKLFLYSTIPLVVAGVIWVGWTLGENLWGGIIIAVMLAISILLAWAVKRKVI